MWKKKREEAPEFQYTSIVDGLKKIYENQIKPVELTYNFDLFHSPTLRESDFEAKPMVYLIHQCHRAYK